MNIKEYIQSKVFTGILIGIFIAITTLVVFQSGVAVGERKASFAHRFGDNFEKNFKDPHGGEGFMQRRLPAGSDMPGGHGAVGEIVSIALPVIVVAGPDNLEKAVVIDSATKIREFRETMEVEDLAVGDFVVVLGTPDEDGQINAKLLRLVPPPGLDEDSIN